MKILLETLKERFDITDVKLQKEDQLFVTIPLIHVVDLVTHLRDVKGFSHLVMLAAVDWLEDGVFQLTYILNNPDKKIDIAVRTFVDRENPVVDSAHHLWAQMATYQRELYEMFGINFPGSPRVDEPFVLEDWDGPPPYRRDFDTRKYSEETYFPRPGRETHDPSEYMKQKLYPEE
jgi:NADH-quinone oxidoreductase subunit C